MCLWDLQLSTKPQLKRKLSASLEDSSPRNDKIDFPKSAKQAHYSQKLCIVPMICSSIKVWTHTKVAVVSGLAGFCVLMLLLQWVFAPCAEKKKSTQFQKLVDEKKFLFSLTGPLYISFF